MAEVTVGPQAKETIITLGDGTIVSATIAQETLTVVAEAGDPVVIDLNSGARGQPGASILVGDSYPLMSQGSIGDIFLAATGANVGAVYKKTESEWREEGNLRGPVGGIETVNGYTGPGVTLTKTDIGLEEADNTSDADKPVSTAQQEALDLKANASDTVNLTGAQTIAGVKTFTSEPVVPDSSFAISKTTGLQSALDATVKLTGTQTISGTKTFTNAPTLQNVSLNFRVPTDVAGGWARGDNLYTTDGATLLGGFGMYGNAATPTHLYIGHGTDPWNATTGLKIAPTGAATFSHGVTAASFAGSGASLTALSGSNISTGTVADARLSTNVALLTGTQTFTGGKTFSTTMTLLEKLVITTAGNSSIEIGRTDGTANTPFIDFHSGATATDYDARILVSGGTGTNGGGTLTITAASVVGITAAMVSAVDMTTAQTVAGTKTFSSSPVVPTPTLSTHAANKGYIDSIVDAAPGTLDTLNELAAALGDDPNFATTMTNSLASKAPLASPTFTGTVSGITKTMVGLGNVDNTADTAKPVSTAQQTALNAKENVITAGTSAQYYRGDKTWATLDKTAVGLSNLQNNAQVDLLNAQTIGGIKSFTSIINANAGISATGQTITAGTFSGSLAATNLTGTISQLRLVPNVLRFEHGSDEDAVRPTGATYVDWIGTVQPNNMDPGDTWQRVSQAGNTEDRLPAGMVVASASNAVGAPQGWHWLEGQVVPISNDNALYNEITANGTSFPYGSNTNSSGGAGTTHFRLPDARGKVLAHYDGSTEFFGIGTVFGTKSVTLTTAQIPGHGHPVTDPGHFHNTTGRGTTWGASNPWGTTDIYFPIAAYGGDGAASNYLIMGSSWYNTGSKVTGITVGNNTGGGGSHNNVQPTLTMRYMIKR